MTGVLVELRPARASHVAYVQDGRTLCSPVAESCTWCGGSGWREVVIDGAARVGRCRCQRIVDLCDAWNRAGVPAAHVDAGMSARPVDWTVEDLPRSLVLTGMPGRGKSFGAAGLLRWLTFGAFRRPMWVEHLDLIGRVRRRASQGRSGSDGHREPSGEDRTHVGEYIRAEALVIDDARGYPPGSFEFQLLEEMLCGRYDRGLPTIVTTNERPEAFGPRLASRLRGWESREIQGVDRRDRRQVGR